MQVRHSSVGKSLLCWYVTPLLMYVTALPHSSRVIRISHHTTRLPGVHHPSTNCWRCVKLASYQENEVYLDSGGTEGHGEGPVVGGRDERAGREGLRWEGKGEEGAGREGMLPPSRRGQSTRTTANTDTISQPKQNHGANHGTPTTRLRTTEF